MLHMCCHRVYKISIKRECPSFQWFTRLAEFPTERWTRVMCCMIFVVDVTELMFTINDGRCTKPNFFVDEDITT